MNDAMTDATRRKLLLLALVLGITPIVAAAIGWNVWSAIPQHDSRHYPPLSQAEAISIALDSGSHLSSPPRFIGHGSEIDAWPRKPGTVLRGDNICMKGTACPTTFTVTLAATPDNAGSGWNLVYRVVWQGQHDVLAEHAWELHVATDHSVKVVREWGDPLMNQYPWNPLDSFCWETGQC